MLEPGEVFKKAQESGSLHTAISRYSEFLKVSSINVIMPKKKSSFSPLWKLWNPNEEDDRRYRFTSNAMGRVY